MVPTRQFLMIPRLMLFIKTLKYYEWNIKTWHKCQKTRIMLVHKFFERWCETWTLKNKAFDIFNWKCLKTLNSILVCYLYDKLAVTYEFKEMTLFKCSNIIILNKDCIQSTCDVDAIESLKQECNDAKNNCECEWYSQLRHKSLHKCNEIFCAFIVDIIHFLVIIIFFSHILSSYFLY